MTQDYQPAMAPSLESDNMQSKSSLKPTSILHRTPWQPPVAESAQGIYITLEDGTHLIDAVGGAAVTCVGNSHPKVMQAIKDQVDKVSCTRVPFFDAHIPFLIAQP
jgi:4-aminobutyrate aminotransferase-like enzyme